MPVTRSGLRDKREQIVELARRYRAGSVRVFGSVARGDLAPWGDVGFLVDPLPGHSLFDRAGPTVELRALLGAAVDVVADAELRDYVRERARAEAVAL